MDTERGGMTMEKNTQKPVARIGERGLPEYVACAPKLPNGTQLYLATPVPRDVLMAAMTEVCGWIDANDPWPDLDDIADRYTGKVQPEPVCQTCDGTGVIGDYLTLVHDCPDCARCESDPELVSYAPDMATCTLRIGDEQYLFDRHVDQPEPVNQQMRAALKAMDEKFKSRPYGTGSYITKDVRDMVAAAIAAEVAQPIVPSLDVDGPEFDDHFAKRIDFYADRHPTLLVRQLASRLRTVQQPAIDAAMQPTWPEDTGRIAPGGTQ